MFPVPPSTSPAAVVAGLGGNFDTGAALMSPTTAASVLATYLGQVPSVTRPPAVGFIGLLLLAYIAVVGLVLVAVFCWHRRRAVVWATVPTLAITAALAAILAGVGAGSGPLVNEVRVSQVTPNGHLAQVLSLGIVELPGGGSRRVDLASPGSETVPPGLIGNLAAGAMPEVTVGQRQRLPGTGVPGTSVMIRGGPRSRGGWAVSETERLAGSIHADVTQNGTVLLGTSGNDRREIDRRRGGPGIGRGRAGTGLAAARPLHAVQVGGLPQQQPVAASLWRARADLTRPNFIRWSRDGQRRAGHRHRGRRAAVGPVDAPVLYDCRGPKGRGGQKASANGARRPGRLVLDRAGRSTRVCSHGGEQVVPARRRQPRTSGYHRRNRRLSPATRASTSPCQTYLGSWSGRRASPVKRSMRSRRVR